MKTPMIFSAAFAGFLSCVSPSALAQAAPPPAGSMDVLSGSFRPYVMTASSVTSRSGTFVFNISATVASTFPASTKIKCSVSANLFDSAGDSDQETSVAAANVSGSKLTCTVMLPYQWTLAAVNGQVSLAVQILAITANQETRVSGHSLPSVSVPADGATTTENLATTI